MKGTQPRRSTHGAAQRGAQQGYSVMGMCCISTLMAPQRKPTASATSAASMAPRAANAWTALDARLSACCARCCTSSGSCARASASTSAAGTASRSAM